MDAEMVSFETVMEHYGIWRWRMELEPASRLVDAWSAISASTLPRRLHVGDLTRLPEDLRDDLG
jgi:hypothetical protein